jgi:hypothetical protein
MLARLAELRAANEAAPSWGAAVGVRGKEIRNLERSLAALASDGVQTRIPDGQQCNEQSGKQLSRAPGGDAADPVQVFAYLVSKCGSGLLLELVADGKSDTQARNQIIRYFLDFAAGEACRIARREGREPDTSKWATATMKAFERAIRRTESPAVANSDAVAPDDARLVSGVSSDPVVQPHESGER